MTEPFIVYSLPRSRTAWLADFLTYRDWKCHHEIAIKLREPSDIAGVFRERIGAVETGVAQGWRLIDHYVPGIKTVVIRRPIEDVVKSLLAVDLRGVAVYDEAKLRKVMEYGDRMLDQIAGKPGTLVIDHDDLNGSAACKRIFEFCLPYRFDYEWWVSKHNRNVQVDVAALLLYYHANRLEIERFKSACKADLRRLVRTGAITKGVSSCRP